MKKFLVFTCATLLLIGLSVPAMAEVNIYGQIYFDTVVIDADKENANVTRTGHTSPQTFSPNTRPVAPNAAGVGGNDDADLIWSDSAITRVGFRFQAGKASANVELNNTVGKRHWWGAYDFDSFELRVGDTYSPLFYASSGAYQVIGGGIAYGGNPTGDGSARPEMVRFRVPLPNKLGNWFLAFCENNGAANAGVPSPGGTAATTTAVLAAAPAAAAVMGAATVTRNVDVDLPQIQTSLRLNFAPTSWLLYAGYQTYEEVGYLANGAEKGYDIDAYTFGLAGSVGLGPLTFKGNIWYAQNPRDFNGSNAGTVWTARYNAVTDGIDDIDAWGFQLTGVFKFNDMVRLEVCYQGAQHERENNGTTFGDDEDDYYQFDVVLPINLVKGWVLVPTIVLADEKDQQVRGVSTDQGKAWMYGLSWVISF